MGPASLIVMMTDFGTEHWYEAAMKGEILRRAPDAKVLDLSHNVPRQAIRQGAFILHCAADSFPRRTIFCCVIDPGVGSDRKALIGWVGQYGFVGPDNGLVTPLLDRVNEERGEKAELYEIRSPLFQNKSVSPTFHGRDVFAPASARLVLGDDPRMAGPAVRNPVRLAPFRGEQSGNTLRGEIMLIDHFGNAISNLHRDDVGDRLSGKFLLKARSLELTVIDRNYNQHAPGEPCCYWGSSGFLEIAVNFGSAAEQFGLRHGDPFTIDL
jgi:S-adenosyl-L-methionine hydrolase (adenosine-forming)